mgnify:CR=1 FL=1
MRNDKSCGGEGKSRGGKGKSCALAGNDKSCGGEDCAVDFYARVVTPHLLSTAEPTLPWAAGLARRVGLVTHLHHLPQVRLRVNAEEALPVEDILGSVERELDVLPDGHALVDAIARDCVDHVLRTAQGGLWIRTAAHACALFGSQGVVLDRFNRGWTNGNPLRRPQETP